MGEMDVEFFVDLLENKPPYEEIPITLQDYEALAGCKSLRIENYCVSCEKVRTFYQNHIDDSCASLRKELLNHMPGPDREPIRPGGIVKSDTPDQYASNFLVFVFSCAHCEEEHLFAIKIDGKSICKIGQYPSFSRSETASLRKYKNLISKYYVELTSAVNAYSQNMGIAAFVYLRRILEHLINSKYSALPDANDQTKFIDKLKAVEATGEAIIPKALDTIKDQIYSVLSKGLHEYSESECHGLFDDVLYVITAILDQELYKKEQAVKAAEAQKRISQKLKEK